MVNLTIYSLGNSSFGQYSLFSRPDQNAKLSSYYRNRIYFAEIGWILYELNNISWLAADQCLPAYAQTYLSQQTVTVTAPQFQMWHIRNNTIFTQAEYELKRIYQKKVVGTFEHKSLRIKHIGYAQPFYTLEVALSFAP